MKGYDASISRQSRLDIVQDLLHYIRQHSQSLKQGSRPESLDEWILNVNEICKGIKADLNHLKAESLA